MKEFHGEINSKDLKIAIVVSQFNSVITDRLLQGALDVLKRTGMPEEAAGVVRVPGSFEIPLAAQRLAQSKKYDAIICLGSVIRGETPHFDYICQQVSRGISQVSLQFNLPVSFGVITADSVEQAMNRAGLKYGNKGEEAALSAIEMANAMRALDADRK